MLTFNVLNEVGLQLIVKCSTLYGLIYANEYLNATLSFLFLFYSKCVPLSDIK